MRRDVLMCLGLVLLNLIGFWPVGHLGFTIYDDPQYVTENPNIQAGITAESVSWALTSTHYAGNWHPVTWLSHMLDWQVFGPNAAGHHWMNLALHIATTVLLFIALRAMSGAAWRSAFVAALFAVHPLHVQSVAWISERKDVLSGLFFMLTLLCYASFAQKSELRSQKSEFGNPASGLRLPASGYYWLALIFFALGLMSKPMLVTVPFILLLLDFWPLGRVTRLHPVAAGQASDRDEGSQLPGAAKRSEDGPTRKMLLREKAPFFGLVLASCLLTLAAQGSAGYIIHVTPLPWYARCLLAPVFCVAYLVKIFWPANLAVFYPYPLVRHREVLGAVLLLGGVSVLCLRQARSRGYLAVGWFWFLVMLVPVIGLVQVGTQSIADRYTYLPAIGLFVAVAWRMGDAAAVSKLWRWLMLTAATAMVVACLADTRRQLSYWRDDYTMFSHALTVTPENNSMCYYSLGNILWQAGQLDAAVTNYRTALQITPGFTDASARLGFILLQQNKPAEAEVEFQKILKSDPADTKAHKYLGDALAAQGKLAEAEAEYMEVLRLNPGNPAVSQALQPELDKVKTALALTNLLNTLKVQPTAEVHAQIAAIQTSQGGYADAVEHYVAALCLKPDAPDILNNLAWLLATCPDDRVRNGAEAVRQAERACALVQPPPVMLLGTLAAAYAEAGRFDDAVATAQRACKLAAQQGDETLLQKNQSLLEIYRQHKPWRE